MAYAAGQVFCGSELPPSAAAGLSIHVSPVKTFLYAYSPKDAFQTARQPQGTVGGSGDCAFVAATSAAQTQSQVTAVAVCSAASWRHGGRLALCLGCMHGGMRAKPTVPGRDSVITLSWKHLPLETQETHGAETHI